MKEFSATDLVQNFEKIGREAMRQPVTIVEGERRWALLSLSELKALEKGDPRRVYTIEDMPDEHAEELERGLTDYLEGRRGYDE